MLENFFEHNIGYNEYITGNKFIELSNNSDIKFCKTDYLQNYNREKFRIFITHNSDYHIDKNRYEQGPKCESWFCQNKDYENKNLIGIPIGLENTISVINEKSLNGFFSSNPNNALQKALFIDSLSKKYVDKEKLAYLNFSINTNIKERKPVYDKFSNETWVTNKDGLSWQEYYWDLANHKFAISPPGNGVDCHRVWECLYLRTIPIVIDSIHMREFEELPIIIVKNWDEITYNFLEEKYEEFESKKFDLSKMKMSYWNKRINEL
jgi:hypothetical protein